MDRKQRLTMADAAATRAASLAREAEDHAHSDPAKTPAFAAASAAWSTVARTHLAIAALLPDTTEGN
ncbi:hypothetical protein [Streptomyces sp. P9-A2]|uniref:hypothetical protein n=1 Tax=Streptomyces sp. P9-A2 TaxID=3072284 RepID=UPI002FCC5B93